MKRVCTALSWLVLALVLVVMASCGPAQNEAALPDARDVQEAGPDVSDMSPAELAPDTDVAVQMDLAAELPRVDLANDQHDTDLENETLENDEVEGPGDVTPEAIEAEDTEPETAPVDTVAPFETVEGDAGDDTTAPADSVVDTGPVLDCIPECTRYQLCDTATGTCKDNPKCLEDFCDQAPTETESYDYGGTKVYMDRFEWPNMKGEVPLGGVSSVFTAALTCISVGKRLCTAAEFSAVCGAGNKYPYGNLYGGDKCNTEFPYKVREAGAFQSCKADEAPVYDVVGNLLEWTAEGKLFGGSVMDGALASCTSVKDSEGVNPALIGFRCCISPTDDLDFDGYPASFDCDDLDPSVHPGAYERCDHVDNDCDEIVDNCPDADKDGFDICSDCNDNSALAYPGAEDTVGDGIDQSCDGIDGTDKDRDGEASVESGGTDCDDSSGITRTGAPEICDGLDNDCDGLADNNLAEHPCDDQNLCTLDVCDVVNKVCIYTPLVCDDGSQCTEDYCDPAAGCLIRILSGQCDDGNPCTVGDVCVGGVCMGSPRNCEDQNVCTEVGCDAKTGDCVYSFNRKPCDDGDPCTLGDVCELGACKAGEGMLFCDDGNQCTVDSCKPGTGCVHTNRTGACEDGDECTVNDNCLAGLCQSGASVCGCEVDQDCAIHDDGDLCNGLTFCNISKTPHRCEPRLYSAVVCPTDKDTACSRSVCDPKVGLCFMTDVMEGEACDDGNACTLGDLCKAGKCGGLACDDVGMSCINGGCISRSCEPGRQICDGPNATRRCDVSGTFWLAAEDCGAGGYCENGQCFKKLCVPGQPSCIGELAGVCDPDGCQLMEPVDDCLSRGAHCAAGVCIECQPLCGGRVCGPDGCGGTCGTCTKTGESCDEARGICVPQGLNADLIYIPKGVFTMGTPSYELGRDHNETQHEVTLTYSFAMMRTEVTQAEFALLAGYNPSSYPECGGTCPVQQVSWREALNYANLRSKAENLPQCYKCCGTPPSNLTCALDSAYKKPQQCRGYRLPTEAEWEYAARAGTTTTFFNGDITELSYSPADPNLAAIAWFGGNSEVSYGGDLGCSKWYPGAPAACGPHPVQLKAPNAWGLYDMNGNVWEWVWDYKASYTGAATDPSGPGSGTYRVRRGGSWSSLSAMCRNGSRSGYYQGLRAYNLGFRLVRTIPASN